VKLTHLLPGSVMLAAVLALGACQQQKSGEEAAQGPDAKPGLTVSDGVLVLPAVKGNPGAAYFALTNGSQEPTSLAAIHIDGAGKAEMHETRGGTMAPMNWAQVNAGETLKFERGGKHVMVFDLTDRIKPGGTAEMTLTFSGGDKLSTPLRVEAAGGDGMEGMH
jgi:copper(I)-binding protein